MLRKVFFSIIIPIYNVEEYLNECIESVLRQTFKNYEVILVDDGSPDKCPFICDEYANNYSNINVIHKKNGGLSDARNVGLENAKGRYILFLDSDDYWGDENALQHIYDDLQKMNFVSDIIVFHAKHFYPNGKIIVDKGEFPIEFDTYSSEQALYYMIENGVFPGSACTMAIKRDFLINNNLYFKLGIRSEDIEWLLRLSNKLPKYQHTKQDFYMYRKGRIGSITNVIELDYLSQLMNIVLSYKNFDYVNENVKYCLNSYAAYQFSIMMAKTFNLSNPNERKAFFKNLVSIKKILKYDLHPKVKRVNKCIKLVGFKGTYRVLGLYLKYRNR